MVWFYFGDYDWGAPLLTPGYIGAFCIVMRDEREWAPECVCA